MINEGLARVPEWPLAGVGGGVSKKNTIYAKRDVLARGWQWPMPKTAWVKINHGKHITLVWGHS